MAVFISAVTDAFGDVDRTRPSPINVRRPLRGFQIKEDTYSIIRVVKANGEEVSLFDSSSDIYGKDGVDKDIGKSTAYANFLMQQLQEFRMEKQQIVETFGEDYIFFFGERPRFLDVAGVLINTKDFNWKSEFWENYDRYLRGTKLVEMNARMYLYFDDVVVEGYIVQAGTTHDAGDPYKLPFQFRMFVSNYAILSKVGSVFFQEPTTLSSSPLLGDDAAKAAARTGAVGGKQGFLATTAQFLTNASSVIQGAIEEVSQVAFGRRISVPGGLESQVVLPKIDNQASFAPAPTAKPIHTMTDEYVAREGSSPAYDKAEIARVETELALQTPKALEAKARADLLRQGVNTESLPTAVLIAGNLAFRGAQYASSFGLRKAGYALDIADQAANQFLFNDPLKGLPISV